MTDNNENVDEIIDALLSVRGARPGRQVNLTENQIRYLCTKTREILINQPVFLELEAPIKVCGKYNHRNLPCLLSFPTSPSLIVRILSLFLSR